MQQYLVNFGAHMSGVGKIPKTSSQPRHKPPETWKLSYAWEGFIHEPSTARLRSRDVTRKGGTILVEGMETRGPEAFTYSYVC